MHREIASRSFSQSLMRLINDRTIHTKVKSRTAELIKQWSDDFKGDSSLGIMTETHNTLKAQGLSLEPPSRPQKKDITEADRRREEEELQTALALSLNESKTAGVDTNSARMTDQQNSRNQIDNGPNAYTVPTDRSNGAYMLPVSQSQPVQSQQLQQTPIEDRTAATVSRCRALYDFVANEAGELTFHRGDVITVIESAYKDWWRGSLHGNIGIFPTNYVENLADPTPADLQREAEEETRIFAEAKNVEKILSLLSSAELSDPSLADNEQLQNLYHSTLSIRPKLVRLIEKYSQKKDDLILLNEKFMQARKDYDGLMEASLTKYSTAHRYTARPAYEARQASPAHYQRPMRSGGYPADAYQYVVENKSQHPNGSRRPLAADQRPNMTGDGMYQQPETRQARTGSIPERYHQQQPQKDQVSFQQSGLVAPQQRPQYSGASDTYRPNQMNALRHGSSEPPYSEVPRQAPHDSPNIVGNMQHPLNPYSGPESSHNTPASPSQELAHAFPSAPEPIRASSYDHARADREGGPPIAYYNTIEQTSAPQYVTPVIPKSNPSARPTSVAGPGYDNDNLPDPAEYYRRDDHDY